MEIDSIIETENEQEETNIKFAINHLSEKYREIKEEEQLRGITVVTGLTRKVLEAKWGLDNGVGCTTYKELSKKLNVEDAQTLYLMAVKELLDACTKLEYVKVFSEYENFDEAVGYGKLLFKFFGQSDFYLVPKISLSKMKLRFKRVFSRFKEDELKFVEMKFGLKGRPKLYTEIGKEYSMKPSRVRHVTEMALEKYIDKSALQIIVSGNEWIPRKKWQPILPENNIDRLNLSLRLFNRLKDAGITNIDEFQKLSEEELKKINIGKRCCNEVTIKQKMLLKNEIGEEVIDYANASSLEEMDMSLRTYMCLKRFGIKTANDLRKFRAKKLLTNEFLETLKVQYEVFGEVSKIKSKL